MGRVALLATRATELALEEAGLKESPVLHDHRTGVAYGSTMGSLPALLEFLNQLQSTKRSKALLDLTSPNTWAIPVPQISANFSRSKGAFFPSALPVRQAARASATLTRRSAMADKML